MPNRRRDKLENIFQSVSGNLPLTAMRAVGLRTCHNWTYILVDKTRMEARLSPEKLGHLVTMVNVLLNRRSATKRELPALLGHLKQPPSWSLLRVHLSGELSTF